MSGGWVRISQGILLALAISLVISFFVITVSKREPIEEPAATEGPAETFSRAPEEAGKEKPGVPKVPVVEHETWPEYPNQNADRQLDYEAEASQVEYQKALSEDLTGYWNQSLTWERCGNNLCTKALVPLDWENPGDHAIEIALVKVPSKNPTRGPLFVNPGGPGAGGQSFATSLGRDAWEGYDIVGWDPRGTGESTHVKCGTTKELDELFGLDGSPDDQQEKDELKAGWTKFAKQCRDASGDLLDHLTTVENVRDLDLLRYLLGADKLNYVGVSYGTYVGAMYAELFPHRAGRLVLDSAVDITDDDSVSQAEGFEFALGKYAQWCASQESCQLGDSKEVVLASIDRFLKGLDANPLQVQSRELTQTLGAVGIALFLYENEDAYPSLTYVLQQAMQGAGANLLEAADALNGRGANGYDTIAMAFPAMRCVDGPDIGVSESYRYWKERISKSPVFSGNAGIDLACELWTADSAPRIKITAEGAPPILVVGTTGDSATPYEHAETMAKQLSSGVLLTLDGAGHGAVTGDNSCIRNAVDKYLLDGTPPKSGTTCS